MLELLLSPRVFISTSKRLSPMSIRSVSVVVCLCVAAAAVFGQCAPGTVSRYVMQFQPPASGNTLFQGFAADGSCTTPAVNANGPTGVSQIVAKPDGTKFFLLGTGGIQSVDPGFSSFQALNGITGTPTAMA